MNIERNADALARVYAAGMALWQPDYGMSRWEHAELATRDFVALLDTLEDEQRAKVGVTAA